MSAYSIQVQAVLYKNEIDALVRSLQSLSNAVLVNNKTSGECGDVVVVYGDASPEPMFTNETFADFRAKFPDIKLEYRFFGENTGYGKGHNILASDAKCDYLLIINPDIILCPEFFHGMFEPFLRDNSDAGMTEARQSPVEHPKDYDKETLETEWATGACILLPTELYSSLGGFDSDTFFMYCEDVDLSWRMRMCGKKIYYRPDCPVVHAKMLSIDGTWMPSKTEVFYSAQAAILMAYKWSAKSTLNSLLSIYRNSNDPVLLEAVKHFEKMKEEGRLPKQIDPSNQIARFVGNYYTEHRFLL